MAVGEAVEVADGVVVAVVGDLELVEDVVVAADEDDVDDGAAVDDGGRLVASLFIAHMPFWQEKPAGQHALPHVGRLVERSVLCIWFRGCAVAFCWARSQVIGWMY